MIKFRYLNWAAYCLSAAGGSIAMHQPIAGLLLVAAGILISCSESDLVKES